MIYDYQNKPIVSARYEDEPDPKVPESKTEKSQLNTPKDIMAIQGLIKENEMFQNEYTNYKNFSDELMEKQRQEIEMLKSALNEKDKHMQDFIKKYEEQLKTLAEQPPPPKKNTLSKLGIKLPLKKNSLKK